MRPAIGLLLSGVVALSAACSTTAEGEARAGTPTAASESRAPVEVHEVLRHAMARRIEVSANVMPLRQEAIVPRVAGRIERIHVDEGDEVAEGQELARLDQRDYRLALRRAQANFAAAKANARLAAIAVSSAASQRDRMKTLADSGAISISEMDKVSDGHRMGEAKQSAAEAQVALALVGLDGARTKVADTVLSAPFAGVVIKRMLDEGAMCGMSPETAAIMVVADLSKVKVQGSVGERDVHLLRRGMPAKVAVDALPDRVFEGTVEVVSPMVDPRTRTSSIRVVVENGDGRLEPGMAAHIDVGLGDREMVAVPDETLIRGGRDDRAEVFVVDGDDRVRRREVRLGARHDELVEIEEGLEAGERVVRSNQGGLSDGDQVVVRSAE